MTEIEDYAIGCVADGGESTAEDDLNEDGALPETDWLTASSLGVRMARAIKDNRESFLAWFREQES